MADLNESYRTLGVLPGASFDEAKAAWRLRAQALHPDHLQAAPAAEQAAAERQFKELSEAWRVVRDHLGGDGSPDTSTDAWRSASPPGAPDWTTMHPQRRVWSPSKRAIGVVVVVAILVVGFVGYRVATSEGGEDPRAWSAASQSRWNDVCQRSGGSILTCRCALDAIMSEVAEVDFPALNQEVLTTGTLPPNIAAATAPCMAPR